MASNSFNTLSYIFENEQIQDYAQENQKFISESLNSSLPLLYNNVNRYVNNNIEQFMSNDISDVYENISEYASNYVYESLDFGSFILSQEQISDSDRKGYYLQEINSHGDGTLITEFEFKNPFTILPFIDGGEEVSKIEKELNKNLSRQLTNDISGTTNTPTVAELKEALASNPDDKKNLIESVKGSIKKFSESAFDKITDFIDSGKEHAGNVLESVKDISFGNNASTYIIASTGAMVGLIGIAAHVNSKRLTPIVRDTIKKINKEANNLSDRDKSKIYPVANKALECGKAKDAKCSLDNIQKIVSILDKSGADTRKIQKNLSKIESQIKE